MKTITIALALALPLTAGCGITGTWKVTDLHPGDARQVFDITEMTLNEDGTGVFTYASGEGLKSTDGTYEYVGSQLDIHTAAHGRYKTAEVLLTDIFMGMRLTIETTTGVVNVYLERRLDN